MSSINPGVLVALNMLADDKRSVPYRKRLNKITDSVTASILLQQMIFHANGKGYQPFFKFRGPCNHPLYREGDSWVEELGFSPAEFDTALKKIGTKITGGTSKAQALQGQTAQSLVIYWTDSGRVTWYLLNLNLLGKFIMSIYLEGQETEDTYQDENPELPIPKTPKTSPDIDGLGLGDEKRNLPRAVDRQQRKVDEASGGQSLDPVLEVAKHLRWGCTGGAGIPLPRGKGKGEYTDAAKKLLDDTDADDWRAVCAAIDGWFEHPPEEDVWMHERAKKPHFALAQIADYWRAMHGGGKKKPANGRASPTSSWLSDEELRIADADVTRRLAEMEAERNRHAHQKAII